MGINGGDARRVGVVREDILRELEALLGPSR